MSASFDGQGFSRPISSPAVLPNPGLKLLDQVRQVMRLKHYSLRTERAYCDWIRRFVKFHQLRSRDLAAASCG